MKKIGTGNIRLGDRMLKIDAWVEGIGRDWGTVG